MRNDDKKVIKNTVHAACISATGTETFLLKGTVARYVIG